MPNKEKWEIERDKENALKREAIKSLTKDQLITIQNTYKIINEVLLNIKEIDDLYLSDIKNLDTCFWKLKNEFLLESNYG
tara:strand:+ start:344 stop:583 length:240 start_codon:yes stop_codon:yes gene_type:complete